MTDIVVDELTRLVASAKRAFLQGVNTARFGPPCDCCDLDPDQLIAADGTQLDKDLTAIEEYAREARRKALIDAAREAISTDTPDRAARAILHLTGDSDREQGELYERLCEEQRAAEAEWEKRFQR